MKHIKRRLTGSEEFEIMKLVLDKFLWLGAASMGYGLFLALSDDVNNGLYFILAGALVLIAFAFIIIREFERIR